MTCKILADLQVLLARVKRYNEAVRSIFEDPILIDVPKPKKEDKASK